MEMKLDIFMRNDLNMRKGKMAAQAAHAVMKRVLDMCSLKNDGLYIDTAHYTTLRQFLNAPEVAVFLVTNEEDLKQCTAENPNGVIVDHGHTEFHGVHTMTCGAVGLHSIEPAVHVDGKSAVSPEDRTMIARQWLVFAKPGSTGEDFSKEKVIELAAIVTLRHMCGLFVCLDKDAYCASFEQYPALRDWLFGAFAKIGLSVRSREELLVLESQVREEGLHASLLESGVGVLIVGPEYPGSISCLSSLKLL
jgi:PTH2 family peptidyl-tRNA hydrolase